jgi:PAS domain-containing protein
LFGRRAKAEEIKAAFLVLAVEGVFLYRYIAIAIIGRTPPREPATLLAGRRYEAADLRVAEELARRAALAVDNARLYGKAQREIAERGRMEEDLRRSERRFRALVQNNSDVVSVFDAVGNVLY